MPLTLIGPLSFQTVTATYTVENGFLLNRYKGTVLKGWLFDERLKDRTFFKAHNDFKNGLPVVPKYKVPPEYIALKYMYNNQQLFAEGSEFKMEVTLVGNGMGLLPEWIQWLETMPEIPIANGKVALNSPLQVSGVQTGLDLLQKIPAGCHLLTLNFLTPAELKVNDAPYLGKTLPFQLLAKAAMERLRLLNFYYAPGNITREELDTTIWLDEATKDIVIKNTDLVADSSLFRNKEDMDKHRKLIPGLVGAIQYEGDIDPWLPLIYAAQKVNIGHLAAWGKGQFIFNVR